MLRASVPSGTCSHARASVRSGTCSQTASVQSGTCSQTVSKCAKWHMQPHCVQSGTCSHTTCKCAKCHMPYPGVCVPWTCKLNPRSQDNRPDERQCSNAHANACPWGAWDNCLLASLKRWACIAEVACKGARPPRLRDGVLARASTYCIQWAAWRKSAGQSVQAPCLRPKARTARRRCRQGKGRRTRSARSPEIKC